MDFILILSIGLCVILDCIIDLIDDCTVDLRPVQTLDHRNKNLDFMTKDQPEDQQLLCHFQNKAKLHTYQHEQLMQIQIKRNLTRLGLGS